MKKFLGLNEYEAKFLIDLLSKSQYENESDNTTAKEIHDYLHILCYENDRYYEKDIEDSEYRELTPWECEELIDSMKKVKDKSKDKDIIDDTCPF